jgi:hypothetical protein
MSIGNSTRVLLPVRRLVNPLTALIGGSAARRSGVPIDNRSAASRAGWRRSFHREKPSCYTACR